MTWRKPGRERGTEKEEAEMGNRARKPLSPGPDVPDTETALLPGFRRHLKIPVGMGDIGFYYFQ
jgi:hypothetical protein